MIIPAWLGPDRLAMTAIAIRLAAKEPVTAHCGGGVEVNAQRWRGLWNGQLEDLQSRKLRGDEVIVGVIDGRVTEAEGGRNGPLVGIVQAFIEERTDAAHIQHGHKRVPIRNCSP